MSNVIYDREVPQAEREANKRRQKIATLLGYLPTHYGELKLTVKQREVVQYLVTTLRNNKAGGTGLDRFIDPALAFVYGYVVLFIQPVTERLLTVGAASDIVQTLGETSEPYQEVMAFGQTMNEVARQSLQIQGELTRDTPAKIHNLMYELNLTSGELAVLLYEDMLAKM